MVRNLSWPAVSHICSLTFDSPIKIDLILKSIPIVVINDDVKESSEYLSNKHDFPTPVMTVRFEGQWLDDHLN